MNGVRVGEGAVVRNAILDKNVVVPPGAEIGVDPVADEKRGFLVEDGLTVLGKDQQFPDRLAGSLRRRARRRRTPSRASATVSWALSPLGLGTTQSSAPPRASSWRPSGRLPAPEGGAVRRDAGQRHHPRTRPLDRRDQLLAALAELVVGELVGTGGGPADDVGDADAAGPEVVAVRVGHARGRVDRPLDDPGLEQRGVEAVPGLREVGLGRRRSTGRG